jgi:peptide/nickel transport system ATP-binding protein
VLTHPSHDFTRALLDAEPSGWAARRSTASDVLVTGTDLAISPVRGGAVIARDIALTIRRGGITGLSGPSGCGKTTLGDTVLGLHRPVAGELHRPERLGVQKLYQDPGAAFAPWRTIRATMSDVLVRRKARRDRIEDQCRPIFSRLGLTPSMLDRRPAAVSGGELQRLALARALLCEAELIFADEPTSRLDAISQKRFMELLGEIAGSGVAILLASHSHELLATSADQMVVLP